MRYVGSAAVLCEAAPPVNGAVSCERSSGFTLCSVECDSGYRNSHTHLYMCDLTTGVWSPPLPEPDSFGRCLAGSERSVSPDAGETCLKCPIYETLTLKKFRPYLTTYKGFDC